MDLLLNLFGSLTLLFTCLFCLFYFTDKRRLINGVLLTFWLLLILADLVLIAVSSDNGILLILGVVIFIGTFFLFPAISLVLGFFLLLRSPELLKNEGTRPHNFLSMIFGMLFMAGWFVIPMLLASSSQHSAILNFLLMAFTCGYLYLIFTFVCYLVSSWLFLINKPRLNQDFLIILGCKVTAEGLTPLLRQRVDRALDFYRRQEQRNQKRRKKKELILIPSGGKGPDESRAEAEAMAEYLLQQGIPESRMLIENQSVNTFENMIYSKQLMDDRKSRYKCLFCTSDYHVFRAGLLSRKAGIRRCSGIGSHTVKYFSYNAFVREYIASMMMHKKFHLSVMFLVCLPWLILILVVLISFLKL